jgi:hypothetical protein
MAHMGMTGKSERGNHPVIDFVQTTFQFVKLFADLIKPTCMIGQCLLDVSQNSDHQIAWLLGHQLYSAAAATGSGWGFAVYSLMRRSISGRKWRSRPCTGQAAPSPKAQIV